VRVVVTLTRAQLRTALRNRRAVVLGIVLPLVLLIAFNSIFTKHGERTSVAGATVPAAAYFTGAMLAYAILVSGFIQLTISLVTQRETGQLKRLRGTPVPTWAFIAAVLLRITLVIAAAAVMLVVFADLGYGVAVGAAAAGELVLYVVLGALAMSSLGIAAASLLPDVDSASAALPLVALVLSLISGIFVPVDQLPSGIADAARVFPLAHLAEGLQSALGTSGDTGLHGGDLRALCLWGVIGAVFAARRFTWTPRAAAP
jgi:ABC-2 type transport system permease protein